MLKVSRDWTNPFGEGKAAYNIISAILT